MSANAVHAWVALGANLGDPLAQVQKAMADLALLPQTRLMSQSSLYRSAPIDATGPDYINAVVELLTSLRAPYLLEQLQKMEQLAGRERPFANASRTLDLDLLLYGNATIASPLLTVPHPRMNQRAFVLLPLAEIAPQEVSAQALAGVACQQIARVGFNSPVPAARR
jgi:2-amino-4-hydroxy-6-hydroxymethyldihydropteridine diphosphokinase